MDKENEKQIKIDLSSIEMYEKTKKETYEKMKGATNKGDGSRRYSDEEINDHIKVIDRAEQDVIEDYLSRGGDPEVLKKFETKKQKTKTKPVVSPSTETNVVRDIDIIPAKDSISSQETYDIIPLPSKGECYKAKLSKIPVAYLTAYDENMIVSPNLYRDKLIIDTILEHKVLSDVINPCDLLEGDREAIILFLRASGYGVEYPITAKDDITGEEFETVIDLSKIGYKEFKLKGDENGYFDFELPVSKHKIKFKFLTHQDNVDIQDMDTFENKGLLKDKIEDIVTTLDIYIDEDTDVSKSNKAKIREAIRTIGTWGDGIDGENARFTHTITNKLERSIVSVDGITDRKMISDFIQKMNVKDSSSLRKYINENEPGIDYRITIQKPESLGGGSMEVFLQLDQFIFLNIASEL